MNDVPSSHEPWDDVDALYRRASALDPSRPSASVDSAILAHAAQVAAERSPDTDGAPRSQSDLGKSRAAWRVWWRPAVFGTLAAAALAGLLVLPRALTTGVGPAKTYRAQLSDSAAGARRVEDPSLPQVAQQTGSAESQAAVAPSPAPAPHQLVPAAPRAQIADERAASGTDAASSAIELAAAAPTPTTPVAPIDATSAPAVADARRETGAPATEPITVTAQRKSQNATTSSPIASAPAIENFQSMLKEEGQLDKPPGSPATLLQAARTGDLRKLQAALDEHTNINSRDNTGATALLLATRNGQQQAVDLLLAKGADPNIGDRYGLTPLMEATIGGRSAIVRALQRAGAH